MNTPLIQLNFYNSMTTMTRYMGSGTITHLVTAEQIARVLDTTRPQIASGWLPDNILSWGIARDNAVRCVAHFPAGIERVQIVGEADSLPVPRPPTVVVGHGQQWRLYALDPALPVTPAAPLYHYPAPNVQLQSGLVCQGNTVFPTASPTTMTTALAAFWESEFNSHLGNDKCVSAPDNIIALWRTLGESESYPIDELLPMQHTIADLITQ